MGAVVVELIFEVICVKALVKGPGNPFVVFCAFQEAGKAANALEDGPFEEQGAAADNVVAFAAG